MDMADALSKCQVLLLFVMGIWVGYGLFRLQDSSFSTNMIKVSFPDDGKKAGMIKKDWTAIMSNKYWPNMNTSLLREANISRTDTIWKSLRWHDDYPIRILYNRIPKTGSTVTLHVLKALSKINKFLIKSSTVNVLFEVSIPHQEVFIQSLYHFQTPLVYDRHIHFVDFPSFGQKSPMYINTVREPIAHFLSFYYFMRKQSMWKHRFQGQQRDMTLDQCLNASLYQCETHRQIRFFCGQSDICRMIDPPIGALQLAKRNIEQYYSIVGINEDLHGFFQILEALLPRYFKGGSDFYLKYQNSHRGFSTKKVQSPLKPKSKELLKKILKYDFELYDFVKQRLHKQKIISEHSFKTSSPTSNKTVIKVKETNSTMTAIKKNRLKMIYKKRSATKKHKKNRRTTKA